jgi:hypothetical protein
MFVTVVWAIDSEYIGKLKARFSGIILSIHGVVRITRSRRDVNNKTVRYGQTTAQRFRSTWFRRRAGTICL